MLFVKSAGIEIVLFGSKNNKNTYQVYKNTKIHAASFSYHFLSLTNIPLIHNVVPF